MIKALDLSRHQQAFRPEAAQKAGIQFVMLRAAYAQNRDRLFKSFAAACQRAGLGFGAYQFCTWHYRQMNAGDVSVAEKIMKIQIKALMDTLKNSGVTGWVALDQELETGFTMGLAPAENTRLLNMACQMLRQAGYAPCVYASASWLKSRLAVKELACPVWAAYYYSTPNDPDFADCLPLEKINTGWSRYPLSLGEKLIGWQYGSIGYGQKYGALSKNIDRNWFARLPEEDKPMEFTPVENLLLTVTSAEKPACQAFKSPDVNSASPESLPLGSYPVLAKGEKETIGQLTGLWVKIAGESPYVLALPDRCRLEKTPGPKPAKTLPVVLRLAPNQLRALADLLEKGGLS